MVLCTHFFLIDLAVSVTVAIVKREVLMAMVVWRAGLLLSSVKMRKMQRRQP